MEAIKKIINVDNENVLRNTKAYFQKTEKPLIQYTKMAPPDGFMTGDEFERRVKEELKQLYKEHGLL